MKKAVLNSQKKTPNKTKNPTPKQQQNQTKYMSKSPMLVKSCPFREALGQRPYVGKGNTPLFYPEIVVSLLRAEGYLHPCDGNVSPHSADYLFLFPLLLSNPH